MNAKSTSMQKLKDRVEFEKSLPSLLSVLDNLPFGVMALEPHSGEILYLTKKATALLKYSDGEGFFKSIQQAYYQKYVEPYVAKSPPSHPGVERFKEGPEELLQANLKKHNGTINSFSVKIGPLICPEGNLLYVMALLAEMPLSIFGKEPSEKKREFFKKIVSNARDISLILDASGKEIFVSNTSFDLLGYTPEEIMEIGGFTLIHLKDSERIKRGLEELMRNPQMIKRDEYRTRHKNGRWVHLEAIAENMLHDHNINGVIIQVRDITQRKKAERKIAKASLALAQSESNYRGLFESSKDGIVKTDIAGNIIEANKAYLEMLGYSSVDELKSSYQRITPEKWHAFEQRIVETQIIPRGFSDDYEKEYIRKDGTVFPIALKVMSTSKNGQPIGMWGIVRDITESKNAVNTFKEMHQKLQQLNMKEHLVKEKERKSLSAEIHDELGQSLTAIKLELGWLLDQSTSDPKLKSKISDLLDLTQTTHETVHRISSELRACAVDEIGLKGAIKCYAKDFQNRSRIKCNLKLERLPDIDRQLEVTIYRIVQEALTNVTRHSKATLVNLGLKEQNGNIQIEVSDNGIGLDQKHLKSVKSLGITGMRERVAYFNGELEFINEKGTTVRVTIPLTEALRFSIETMEPPIG